MELPQPHIGPAFMQPVIGAGDRGQWALAKESDVEGKAGWSTGTENDFL